MDIKSHPDYWKTHKEIYQQEYDNLNLSTREIVVSQPRSKEARSFNQQVIKEVAWKLLSLVE